MGSPSMSSNVNSTNSISSSMKLTPKPYLNKSQLLKDVEMPTEFDYNGNYTIILDLFNPYFMAKKFF